jgi:lysozyme family protein
MRTADEKRFQRYKPGYAETWRNARIRPEYRGAVEAVADRIIANKKRYQAISDVTNVPWFVVGLLHKMECELDFGKHLHNGDSLKRKTWRVPAGRPVTGSAPFTFEESAIDALTYDGLDKCADWGVERLAFMAEKFNGFGYYQYGVQSPYLWSFTTVYTRGKYATDGVYKAGLVSKQSGVMAVLKVLIERDADVRAAVTMPPAAVAATDVDESEVLGRAGGSWWVRSRTFAGTVIAGVGSAYVAVRDWFGTSPEELAAVASEVAKESGAFAATLTQLASTVGVVLPWIGAAAVAYGLYVIAFARITDHFARKAQ